MVITIKRDYSSPIVNGRRVHIEYEPGVIWDGVRTKGIFHCRVVGKLGWRRYMGVMLTDNSGTTDRTRAFEWATHEAIEVALLRSEPEMGGAE